MIPCVEVSMRTRTKFDSQKKVCSFDLTAWHNFYVYFGDSIHFLTIPMSEYEYRNGYEDPETPQLHTVHQNV